MDEQEKQSEPTGEANRALCEQVTKRKVREVMKAKKPGASNEEIDLSISQVLEHGSSKGVERAARAKLRARREKRKGKRKPKMH